MKPILTQENMGKALGILLVLFIATMVIGFMKMTYDLFV